jgi:hypothetical protein
MAITEPETTMVSLVVSEAYDLCIVITTKWTGRRFGGSAGCGLDAALDAVLEAASAVVLLAAETF